MAFWSLREGLRGLLAFRRLDGGQGGRDGGKFLRGATEWRSMNDSVRCQHGAASDGVRLLGT